MFAMPREISEDLGRPYFGVTSGVLDEGLTEALNKSVEALMLKGEKFGPKPPALPVSFFAH
jgi:hypothetical protein